MLNNGSEALSEHLQAIPTDVDLFAADRELVDDDSAADQLWELLNAQEGVAWVTAGKLLARKRPRLIPVYDDIVRVALGAPKNYWISLWEAFQERTQIRTALRRSGKTWGSNGFPC